MMLRQRGLAGARRPPEDQGRQLLALRSHGAGSRRSPTTSSLPDDLLQAPAGACGRPAARDRRRPPLLRSGATWSSKSESAIDAGQPCARCDVHERIRELGGAEDSFRRGHGCRTPRSTITVLQGVVHPRRRLLVHPRDGPGAGPRTADERRRDWPRSGRRCRARSRAPPRTPPRLSARGWRPATIAEAAHQAGAQVRHDVAVEVGQQQHVVASRAARRDPSHMASTMRSSATISGYRRRRPGGSTPGRARPSQLHDVRLVDGRHPLPATGVRAYSKA